VPDDVNGMVPTNDTISCIGLSELIGLPVRKPHKAIQVCEGEWRPMKSLSQRCVGYRFWRHSDHDK